jgi:HEPN domain-containing protein
MPNRAGDWFRQAERDLEQAVASARDGLHEWACFAAQQAAEKATKALHLAKGQEAWGHVVARLLAQLPLAVPPDLIEKARVQLLRPDPLRQRPPRGRAFPALRRLAKRRGHRLCP